MVGVECHGGHEADVGHRRLSRGKKPRRSPLRATTFHERGYNATP